MSKFNFKSRIPRYNDDSDYTTNAPSYYDDLARKNKLIKELAKRIWEYEKTLYESLEEIENILNEYIYVIDGKIETIDNVIGEGFNDRIELLLREWLADGTLDHIINEVIFEEINNDIKKLRDDMEDEIERVENDIKKLRDDMEDEIERVEDDYNKKMNCINNDLLYLGKTTLYRGDE